jgi:hypothetical protein
MTKFKVNDKVEILKVGHCNVNDAGDKGIITEVYTSRTNSQIHIYRVQVEGKDSTSNWSGENEIKLTYTSKETITGELRKSLLKLGKSSRYVYSDPRSDGKVGVKFTGVYLTELETTWLKNEMEGKGFKYHSIHLNNTNKYSYCKGTRFTFYNK